MPAGTPRLPRRVHPVAWWLWATGLATAASRTDNPVLLASIIAVVVVVVAAREDPHGDAPLGFFLVVGLVAIGLRVVLGAVLGAGVGGTHVVVTLPQVPLPEAAGSVRLGGPIVLEGLVSSLCLGLQLAAMLAAVGGANALASPRRLLRHVPATLYDVGTAVVVALSFAPRMVVDARSVRAARRLRGHDGHGLRELTRTIAPVLESSLDRSLDLAASMEARGYGRRRSHDTTTTWRWPGAVTVLGLAGLVAGLFGLLDGSAASPYGLPLLVIGVALCTGALLLGARTDARTRYRHYPWSVPENLVAVSGLVPATVMVVLASRQDPALTMSVVPLLAPATPAPALAAIAVAALAALAAPPLPAAGPRRHPRPAAGVEEIEP